MTMTRIINYLTCLAVFLLLSVAVKAQPAFAPNHTETYVADLGVHNGMVTTRKQWNPEGTLSWYPEDYTVIKETVRAGAAPWMQLKFENVNLGNDSYVLITSLFDRDFQYFNAKSIADWHNYSALFKGNAVNVELFVAPNDQNISLRVTELIVGEFIGDDITQMNRTQCGPYDDRSSSGYPYVDGRLMTFGCTGWTTSAGFYLTAGHCEVLLSSSTIFEFHVPASLANGTTQPASVTNQYPVNYTTSVGQNAGTGDDYGIYSCGANSNTGLTPTEAERAYYHLSKDLNPPNMFVRGYGTDNVPPGSTGGYNSDNQTLQFHTGPANGEVGSGSDIYWEYQTDTEGGNSGSADLASGISGADFTAVGIHTHGGCATTNPPTGYNKGTSFEADDTEVSMNTFWGSQVEYVDVDHHTTSTNGTSVQPHYSVQVAANQANAGHGAGRELLLIAGSNNGSGGVYTHTFSYSGAINGVTLRHTVGAVKIGPGATAPAVPNTGMEGETNVDPGSDLVKNLGVPYNLPVGPSLQEGAWQLAEYAKVYPNPFNENATLEILLNEERTLDIYLVNALGQVIRTLVSGESYDAGMHKIEIEGWQLAEGIYHVMVEGANFHEMHKISVIH
jgi:V8-like Glu-specific endopeptidase